MIALQKLQSLLNTEAELTVLAPVLIDEVRACRGEFPNIRPIKFIERDYKYGDEEGYFIVIAATNIPELNRSIANRCHDQMILANSVDDPDACDFFIPSVIEARSVKVAISTDGKAPSVSQRMRKELQSLVEDRYMNLVDKIHAFREKVKNKINDPKQQARRSKLIRWYTDRLLSKN